MYSCIVLPHGDSLTVYCIIKQPLTAASHFNVQMQVGLYFETVIGNTIYLSPQLVRTAVNQKTTFLPFFWTLDQFQLLQGVV